MYKNIAKQDFRKLLIKLDALIADRNLSLIEKFNQSIALVNDFLHEVRSQVTSVAFQDKFEEIYFFKFEKPEYYAQKIYQVALFTLLNQKPVGTVEMIKTYFVDELAFVSRFFKQHAFYYEYYRSGFTELDEPLFLRESLIASPLLIDLPDLDPEFSTGGDYLFAKFIAYEQLRDYILDELKKLENKDASRLPSLGKDKKRFDWTGEMINIVEMGYSLYVSKQMNDGKASLADIFRWLEESFGVELGIPANRFREIKRRKRITRTHFLDSLRSDLLDYMDKDDN
ncbi:RteC domain-containing protein [Pedobacter sp. MC2016-15]|uniref:RteC domain-containing protein n=1 Tax=Pedobacter sp. MC2016-15 TaxID=2994473 RepID=UPI002245654B|nr:RteC domain-containing protein [Pedobacter sp. MC2016-15]MCX2479342.1 RteC domain-containing protein [Pedobacter sp. MC2016-15]